MKRKILSTLVAVVLMIAALVLSVSIAAAEGPDTNVIRIVPNSTEVRRENTFTAQISFTATSGVSSIEFDLTYDAGISLDSVTKNSDDLTVTTPSQLTTTPLHIVCAPKTAETVPSADNILLLTFNVLGDAEPGVKNITLTNVTASDSDDQAVALTPQNATITVAAKTPVTPGLSNAAINQPYSGLVVDLPTLNVSEIAADGTPVTSVKVYSDSARTIELDAATVKNAGVYYIRGSYEDTAQQGAVDGTITITRVSLSLTDVTAASREYDATANVTLSGGELSGAVNSENPAFSLGAGTVGSADVGDGKTVTYAPALTGDWGVNYVIASKNDITVSITAATPTYAVAAARNIKAGSALDAFKASAPSSGTGVGYETVAGTTVWYSDGDRTTPAQESDVSGLTYNADEPVTKTLYWKFTPESTNYIELTGQTVFTIVDGDPQPLTFADGGESKTVGKTYGDGTYTNALQGAHGTVSYASGNTEVATIDSGSGAVTIVGAGDAVITVTAAAVPGEWAVSTESYTLSVGKKTPVLSDVTFTISTTDVYSGAPQGIGAVTANIAPLTGFGTITVKYDGAETAPTNAGTYTVTADIAAGANYSAAVLTLDDYTIAKMPIDGSVIGGIESSYLYTGAEIAPEPTVTLSSFAPVRGDDYTVSFADNTGAGAATVTISGAGNFSGAKTATFTIRPFVTGVTRAAVAGSDAPAGDGHASHESNESKVKADVTEISGGYAVTVTKKYGETLTVYLLDNTAEAEDGAQPYIGLVFELDPGGGYKYDNYTLTETDFAEASRAADDDDAARTNRFVLWYKYGADKTFTLTKSNGTPINVTVRSEDEPAPKYALNIMAGSGGALGGTAGGEYAVGTSVTVTATPNNGYRFKDWTISGVTVSDEEKSEPTLAFTMPANAVTLTANFQSTGGGIYIDNSNGNSPSPGAGKPAEIKGVSSDAGNLPAELKDITVSVTEVKASSLPSGVQELIKAGSAMAVDISATSGKTAVNDFKGAAVAVSVPFKLADGKKPSAVAAYQLVGGKLTLAAGRYDAERGRMTIKAREAGQYVIKVNDVKYTVTGGWYDADSFDLAMQRGLLDSYITDGKIDAGAVISREDFVVAVMKSLGITPLKSFTTKKFNDVSGENADYLNMAKELGVVGGTSSDAANPMFEPKREATRGEQFQTLYNLINAKLVTLPTTETGAAIDDFADAASVPEWLRPALSRLLAQGIVMGDGANLGIKDVFTLGATAEVLGRLV
ncbi:MAG: YDG domain-containing protein [Oscillospiraceae bacterium]|jgi:hypothetical protein|nr:YDG domain-containing protein [Oscillospiraceae bacterium]